MPSKVFRSIHLHINPEQPDDDDATKVTTPWFCDLSLLTMASDPTVIFAIGLDDPLLDRFMYCTSLNVSVKQTLFVNAHDAGLALAFQRPYAMLRRQPNSSESRPSGRSCTSSRSP